jgi:hypothetical protein
MTSEQVEVDKELKRLAMKYGSNEVLRAFCVECNDRGDRGLFRKLNKIYEWLIK